MVSIGIRATVSSLHTPSVQPQVERVTRRPSGARRVRKDINMGYRSATLAVGLPMEYGPPDIVKPSRELLGEMLVGVGQYAEAQREFTRALDLAPKRARSLIGLARAATAAGDPQTADRARKTIAEIWHSADQGLDGRYGGMAVRR